MCVRTVHVRINKAVMWIRTLFYNKKSVKNDLAPCKDRVLIGDTLYTNYKLLEMH